MPATIREIVSGGNLTTAQPIGASTQDGDTVLLLLARAASALPSQLVPAFDVHSHFTSTVIPGCRVSYMTWNTGDPTSFSSTNGNMGYAFVTFVGPVTFGVPVSATGSTGPLSVPGLTLLDSDGSSRVLTAAWHRDATLIETVDGTTKLVERAAGAGTIMQIAATPGGVTSWPGDPSVGVTDSTGTNPGWRGLALEVLGPDAAPPPAASGGFFHFA